MAAGLGGYSSIGGAVSKMWREEGLRGFYKGLYPNLLKVQIPVPPQKYIPRFYCGSRRLSIGGPEYGGKLVYL